MKFKSILIAMLLSLASANAADVMQTSMYKMEQGMNQIQVGFMHNSKDSIKNGIKMVTDGMNMFKEKETIGKYLPEDKKHLSNVAVNSAKNVLASLNMIEANMDALNIKKAAQAYGNTMNSCAKCHSIIRSW